jgi:hypothetical protein
MPKAKKQQPDCFRIKDIDALECAINDAWNVLSGSEAGQSKKLSREEVTRHIIILADEGERDQAIRARRAINRPRIYYRLRYGDCL